MVVTEARSTCERCKRPTVVCYCQHLPRVETRTRVLLLQHPRESDMPIGTAHMASLCLPNAELHVGIDWQNHAPLARAISDPERPAILLYPGEDAIDVRASPPPGPVTLIVVDGTWSQAKKLVRLNPNLAKLPRYSFVPPRPSEYRIRREPHETYVSTIEALVHVLGALEGDPARFEALLIPFRAMVDMQIEHASRAPKRRQKIRALKQRATRVPSILRDRAHNLVCVYGEANGWPYDSAERKIHPEELVHWAALRMDTGESFESVVRPKGPLAPNTSNHIAIDEATILNGEWPEQLVERFRAFVRDDDVICTWGTFAPKLFNRIGGYFPDSKVDLRQVAHAYSKGKVGALADFHARVITEPNQEFRGRGRALLRLSQLVEVANFFARENV